MGYSTGGGGGAGPPGADGATGPSGPPGFSWFDDPNQEEPWVIPGPAGKDGTSGTTGAQGPIGPPVYLESDPLEDWPTVVPGNPGPTGVPGPQGVAERVFFIDDQIDDWPFMIPGKDGAAGPAGAAGTAGGAGMAHSFIGYNTIGGTADTMVDNRVYAKQVTISSDCWITSIDCYVDQGASDDRVQSVSAALFSDNAGAPNQIIAQSQAPDVSILMDTISGVGGNTSPRWLQQPLSAWVTAGTYWIAVQFGDNNAGNLAIRIYEDGSGSDRTYDSGGRWIADWGWYAQTITTKKFSIRASIAVASQGGSGVGAGVLVWPDEIPSTAEDAEIFQATSAPFTFTTMEKDLGTGFNSGTFTFTPVTAAPVGAHVLMKKAVGPYTSKGTLADEAEMDLIDIQAYVSATNTVTAYWHSRDLVRGNHKFDYLVSAG